MKKTSLFEKKFKELFKPVENIDYDENNFLTTLSKKNFEKFGQKISECIVEAIEPKNMSIYFR